MYKIAVACCVFPSSSYFNKAIETSSPLFDIYLKTIFIPYQSYHIRKRLHLECGLVIEKK